MTAKVPVDAARAQAVTVAVSSLSLWQLIKLGVGNLHTKREVMLKKGAVLLLRWGAQVAGYQALRGWKDELNLVPFSSGVRLVRGQTLCLGGFRSQWVRVIRASLPITLLQ